MTRRWYTKDEWSKHIGWGELPDEYAKPKEKTFDYRDEDHPHESWDQFLVRKHSELREKKIGEVEDDVEVWVQRLIRRIKRKS